MEADTVNTKGSKSINTQDYVPPLRTRSFPLFLQTSPSITSPLFTFPNTNYTYTAVIYTHIFTFLSSSLWLTCWTNSRKLFYSKTPNLRHSPPLLRWNLRRIPVPDRLRWRRCLACPEASVRNRRLLLVNLFKFVCVCFETLVTDFPAKLLVFLFSCQSFLLLFLIFIFLFWILYHFFVD